MPAPQGSWQYRAVKATEGNQSLLGCFVLAILGWQHGRKPPRFGSVAKIDKDGLILSNLQDKSGNMYRNHVLGPVSQLVGNLNGLADYLKLNDDERKQMFDEFRKWIYKDERAKSEG